MTRLPPLSYEHEELIYCKQLIMHVMAWVSLQRVGTIDHLVAMLNDITTAEKADDKAIEHFIKAVEAYKEEQF